MSGYIGNVASPFSAPGFSDTSDHAPIFSSDGSGNQPCKRGATLKRVAHSIRRVRSRSSSARVLARWRSTVVTIASVTSALANIERRRLHCRAVADAYDDCAQSLAASSLGVASVSSAPSLLRAALDALENGARLLRARRRNVGRPAPHDEARRAHVGARRAREARCIAVDLADDEIESLVRIEEDLSRAQRIDHVLELGESPRHAIAPLGNRRRGLHDVDEILIQPFQEPLRILDELVHELRRLVLLYLRPRRRRPSLAGVRPLPPRRNDAPTDAYATTAGRSPDIPRARRVRRRDDRAGRDQRRAVDQPVERAPLRSAR